jgi:hypothetical protein
MFEVLHKNHPDIESAISFVSENFRRTYGAEIRALMPYFIRVKDRQRRCKAVMGYRDATSEHLYLEHYLDEPVEEAISRHLGRTVERSEIVEVGNLAEASPGDARMAIIGATAYFHAAGYRWVVFVGITRLRNAFVKLGLSPQQLIEADERRLPEGEVEQWGSYYDGDPVVCFGSIEEGHDNLQEMWESLRDTWAAAEETGKKMARMKVGV